MTIIAQNVTLVATGGGTPSNDPQKTSWVKMDNTRLIYVYTQSSPNGRRFIIIDNPDGLNSATVPTITSGITATSEVTSAEFYTAKLVKLLRVNSNTFACLWRSATLANPITIEFFNVNGTTITRLPNTASVASGNIESTNYGGPIPNIYTNEANAFINGQQPIGAVTASDNTILVSFIKEMRYLSSGNTFRYYQNHQIYKVVFNTTDNTVTSSKANSETTMSQNNWGGGDVYGYLDYYTNPTTRFNYGDFYEVTGFDGQTYLAFRMIDLSKAFAFNGSNFLSHFVIPSSISVSLRQIANNANACWLGADRRVEALFNGAKYFNLNSVGQGGASYFPTVNPAADENLAPFSLPLSANHFMVIDSQHFYDASKPLRMKVIVREDANFITPSKSSQSQYGFTVTPPQLINPCWDKRRPIKIGDDVMWCGQLVGTTNKFAYNIIKQPPLSN